MLADFDKLWDYQHPALTERKFAKLLPTAEQSGDAAYLAQLLTQIARAQGLQGRFEDALATLDRAAAISRDDTPLPRIRELLERGRVFNSSRQAAKAMPLFESAWRLAERERYSRYAIDAVHMLAIAASDPREQIQWNLRGLEMVHADPSQKRWLAALYNNLGESYAKAGEYQAALEAFEKLEDDPYALKDQSRMLRLLGRPKQALSLIDPLVKYRKTPDGWISAEYAECLAAMGNTIEAQRYAAEGYALLKDDAWLRQNDPAMLERLKSLATEA